ncbi:hypothetical protein [Rubrivivax albus]|nr:hypothetical protein [Rubrivivax albus]MCB1997430.1 hypothetical protein [Rhodoferax sp.]
MLTSPSEMQALERATQSLERPLAILESALTAMSEALRERDASRIESAASELHRALAGAVDQFGRCTRQGPIPAPLRRRLMAAGAQVAAQREILARATASLDRAIDVLLPAQAPDVYAAGGLADRSAHSGSTHA